MKDAGRNFYVWLIPTGMIHPVVESEESGALNSSARLLFVLAP